MGQALRDPGAEKSVTRARGRGRTGWARSIVTYATHLLEILHELEHSLIGLLRARRGPGGGGEISRGRRRRRRATEGTAATPAASVRAVPILHRTLRGMVSVPSTSKRARVFPVFWRFASDISACGGIERGRGLADGRARAWVEAQDGAGPQGGLRVTEGETLDRYSLCH